VHKTANVLAKLPKSQQPKAKRALQEIWMAETKVAAELAFEAFLESYALKYEKAADCLAKDRDTLLAFYDFPAEHWKHLRVNKRPRLTPPSLSRSIAWRADRRRDPAPINTQAPACFG
jgi:transposase-like protein